MTPVAARVGVFVLALVAGYGLVCAAAWLGQRSLMYLPGRWSEAEARRANPGYEEVRFPSADGVQLHGWLHRRETAPWTVIVFHGNAGNLAVQAALMEPFEAMGLQVLLFDYRGYGLSTGSPSEAGLLADGEAAAEYVTTNLGVPAARTVFYGKSLGTGVAVLLAARRPPGRLILESSFDSMVSVARAHYPWLPVRTLLRDRYDAASAIGAVRCPILFVHGGADEIVPIRLGRALYECAAGPKRFLEVPGALHNTPPGAYPAVHLETLRAFLEPAP